MLASAGRWVKRPVESREIPPDPPFQRGEIGFFAPSSKEEARTAVPFFKGGLNLPACCFNGAARVPRSASSERVADSP